MRDRLLLAGLICCAPFAIAWLIYKELRSDIRRPVTRLPTPLDPAVNGDGARVPGIHYKTIH